MYSPTLIIGDKDEFYNKGQPAEPFDFTAWSQYGMTMNTKNWIIDLLRKHRPAGYKFSLTQGDYHIPSNDIAITRYHVDFPHICIPGDPNPVGHYIPFDQKEHKVFWRGATTAHSRKEVVEARLGDIKFIKRAYHDQAFWKIDEDLFADKVSPEEASKYTVWLSLEGWGTASDTTRALMSGSCVIFHRKTKPWFDKYLVHGKNCIITETLDDLKYWISKLDRELAREIAKEGEKLIPILKNPTQDILAQIPKSLAYYTVCFGGGASYKIPKPHPTLHSYYFTNNTKLYTELLKTSWKPVFIDVRIKDDPIEDAFDSKHLKACPHAYPILTKYDYTCYFDSKLDLPTMEGQDYTLQIHPFVHNVSKEFEHAMKQPRYKAQEQMIRKFVAKCPQDKAPHYQTGIIWRNMKTCAALNEKWYKAIRECGIECQISFNLIKENVTSFLPDMYTQLCNKKSDINEHLPTLRRYAEQCDTIVECGVRTVVSSWAFKVCKQLWMIDPERSPEVDEFLKLHKHAHFLEGSDLDVPLKKCDLLFIDTYHVYGQLKRELERWHNSVSKYIILHDTEVDAEYGESIRCHHNIPQMSKLTGIPIHEITKGLKPALDEFLATTDWKIEEHFTNNNGLTVLSKKKNKKCFYSALFGKSDKIGEFKKLEGWDYLMYTDQEDVGQWTRIPTKMEGSPVMSAKKVKYNPPYELSVWVDAYISPMDQNYWDNLVLEDGIYCQPHPTPTIKSPADELKECFKVGKINREMLNKTLPKLNKKHDRMWWSMITVFKGKPDCSAILDLFKVCYRDQVWLPYFKVNELKNPKYCVSGKIISHTYK